VRQTIANRKKAIARKPGRGTEAAELLEFFYPAHYEIGTALEDLLRADLLSRQQAASLWLIRAQGVDGCRIRRKDIEANVRRWFEVTNAAVSRALREMMRPPLELIEITEDPRSGREKVVSLTPKGKAYLKAVSARATALLAELIEDVQPELVDSAIVYLGQLTRAFQHSKTRSRIRLIRTDQHSGKNPSRSRQGEDP
jgi:DNA-binding MarR family transcriptional regulator